MIASVDRAEITNAEFAARHASNSPASATITQKDRRRTRNRSVNTPAQTIVIAESVVPRV